jgi:hypothetical protein
MLGHVRRYNIDTIRRLLSRDFNIEFVSFRYFFIFPAVLAVKLMNKKTKPHIEAPRLPAVINTLMLFILRGEIALMAAGIALPLGISLVGICKKK